MCEHKSMTFHSLDDGQQMIRCDSCDKQMGSVEDATRLAKILEEAQKNMRKGKPYTPRRRRV